MATQKSLVVAAVQQAEAVTLRPVLLFVLLLLRHCAMNLARRKSLAAVSTVAARSPPFAKGLYPRTTNVHLVKMPLVQVLMLVVLIQQLLFLQQRGMALVA